MDASGQTPNQLTLRHYNGWQLIKAYWQSSDKLKAYFFLFFILLMTITIVGVDVIFNYWYNQFYNALQAYNARQTLRLIGVFCIIAFVFILLSVYRYYLSQLFALRWRKWLTQQFLSRWLAKRGYYYLESFDEKTDNPDQRIQEDIGALITNTIDLFIGIVSSIATIFAFVYILWQLSGVMHFHLGALGEWKVPGYLVWVSLFYSLIGTWLAFKIGRPLIMLNFEQQRREASFRYAAIDLRSHAEHVALYRGESYQHGVLSRSFSRVLDNWYLIILRQKMLLWFTAGFNQLSVLLPLAAVLPNYFEKVFLLGGLMQSLQAFGKVQDAMSYLVNSYTQIAQWRAISRRLTSFVDHLNNIEEEAASADHLVINKEPKDNIIVSNVNIDKPHNLPLLKNINTEFVHGEHYIVKGESGIGKSTFVRTLAGIWPFAAGQIQLPANKKIMFLPQKPYMPIGTLAEALLFPDRATAEQDGDLQSVLTACHLAHLIPRLHDTAAWSEQLSPGEQQRIAFARVLLQKPDWVIFDESTSMLDLPNEEWLYRLIKEKLPNCSMISVGHRASLDAYHDHIIDMTPYKAVS